ncbi:phytanoyl-CoA dioxygenase family protein [Ekhidna sp. To15]|uniref:phytanoyl-CoA dioxygenase family protein n=1 Tax=Ekhidna sp. To15 TaxID=3395267 RepID=UPI003F51F165
MEKITLTESQKEFWFKNSYLVFKGVFTKEISKISNWVKDISKWPLDMSKQLNFYEMHNPEQLSRIENFVPYHQELGNLLVNDTILPLISELMGEEAILYKDRINFKAPGGGAHSAHQDGVAYESGSLRAFDADVVPYISILIGIDPATKENGCLEVVPNWALNDLSILPMESPDPDHPNFSKMAQSVENQLEWLQLETGPGDVVLFTERLPHRSAINNSNTGRRILYGVYNPKAMGDMREKYYEDKRKNINDPRYMVGNPHAPS